MQQPLHVPPSAPARVVVLASGTGKEGPGPLVSMFGSTVQAIPVTIVPGNFTNEQIDALA